MDIAFSRKYKEKGKRQNTNGTCCSCCLGDIVLIWKRNYFSKFVFNSLVRQPGEELNINNSWLLSLSVSKIEAVDKCHTTSNPWRFFLCHTRTKRSYKLPPSSSLIHFGGVEGELYQSTSHSSVFKQKRINWGTLQWMRGFCLKT